MAGGVIDFLIEQKKKESDICSLSLTSLINEEVTISGYREVKNKNGDISAVSFLLGEDAFTDHPKFLNFRYDSLEFTVSLLPNRVCWSGKNKCNVVSITPVDVVFDVLEGYPNLLMLDDRFSSGLRWLFRMYGKLSYDADKTPPEFEFLNLELYRDRFSNLEDLEEQKMPIGWGEF